ncbi:MAG: 2-dehydropantoate 2-reductase [Opitutales bacterium]|jgi:2-dehydropantoate 2-reductase
MKSETIGIVGAGALGCYFGIRLAAAGNPVTFLLRSDYQAVREHGMELALVDGTMMRLEQPGVVDSVQDMGRMDWVIIGLKATRNHLYERLLRPVVGPGTVLITVQNGLGNAEALRDLFPGNPVMGALCQIGVNREGPGRIRSFVQGDGFVQLGGDPPVTPEMLEQVRVSFEKAGIRTRITPSLGEALWRKLMWNVPFNGLTVEMGGEGTDAVCGDPVLRARARALMEEIRIAGNALGYPIEPGYTDKLLEFTDKLGAYMASSVLDWRAGRRIEVDAIFRKPLEAGTAAGVPMPELKRLVAALEAC